MTDGMERGQILDMLSCGMHDVKIADFGLSKCLKRVGEQDAGMTACGTLDYLAPEVLTGQYDERIDFWSFGVLLYVMLCGRMPFEIEGVADIKRISRERLSPQGAWQRISEEAKDMVQGLLCVDPADRLNEAGCLRHPWLEEKVPPPSAMATTSQAVAATGAADGQAPGFRDREPPPPYDGEDPESTFALWERNVRLWEYETDVPRGRRGAKLMRALTGSARIAVEEMPFEDIACEDGMRNIMARLREFFQPHLEVSLPRAFENAVYGQPRTSKEGFGEYIARMDRGFSRLAKEGISLPESAQGYIVYRQASLSEAQDQRFLVWSDGKYDRSSVVKALRKLDKVVKERGKSNYLMDAPEYDGGIFSAEGEGIWDAENDDDENYVYIQEGDLGEVMDEEDVMHALASYREIRQAMKDQRKGRGFYGKGVGSKGKSKGAGKWQKVHTEQLKMRSRCWKCGQVGHWSKECSSDGRNRTNPSSAASGAGMSSSVSTAKSGFLVVSGQSEGQEGRSAFWLRKFIADQAKTKEHSVCGAYKSDTGFSGIATFPEHGVVDTAAEGGLIGRPALDRLEKKLNSHGVRVKWIPKTSTAKGVGGNATCLGVVLIPIGIAGVNGILETTVVDGDVPLLLPVRMLTGLKAIINLESLSMKLQAYDVEVPLHELPSGHVTVDIMEFDKGKFSMPMELQRLMASLVARLRRTGNTDKVPGNSDEPMDVRPPTHHSKRAIRGWRVVMDKVWVLLVFAEHQRLVEEWFPQSQPLRGSPSEPKEETLADVYAAMIVGAKALTPLKSKETPKISISSCCHPKSLLKGGGNASQSYIVCKGCNARWENSLTTAEIKKYMKEHKEEKRGLLSQSVESQSMMDTTEWVDTVQQQAGLREMEQVEMRQQIAELQNALQQEQLRTREVERVMMEEFHQQLRNMPALASQGPAPVAVLPIQAKARSLVTNQVAEALIANQDYNPVEQAQASEPRQEVIIIDDDGNL
eukprot:s1114_g4.t3